LGKTSKGKAGVRTSRAATTINILLIAGALLVTAGIVWYSLSEPPQTDTRASLPKPNITTLDPAKFTNRTKLAYEAAREVPEVLAQLPCYCGCMSGFGHRNNLDCFHDEHGVECTMCQQIALDARDMYKNGYEIDRIRQAIKDRYGRYAAVPPE
jgi:Protein of unknown function with PCYCGC motif